jgi:hypothetical protein
MWLGGIHHALAVLPMGKTRCPLYRRLGGPQGRSGRVRKISSSRGFNPRTVQYVASRNTDWAIPAHTDRTNTKKECSLRYFVRMKLPLLRIIRMGYRQIRTGFAEGQNFMYVRRCVLFGCSGFKYINKKNYGPYEIIGNFSRYLLTVREMILPKMILHKWCCSNNTLP